jgi:hypothetical protein
MRGPIFLSVVVLASQATSYDLSNTPSLQWDPDTADDCIGWVNHHDEKDETCEWVRDYFTMTPEQFHKWNPSIGLDCKPWHEFQSYCIVTMERLKDDPPPPMPTSPSTITTATAATSTSTTPVPSPTAWDDKGCYVETPELPLLEQNMSPAGGDNFLTVPKCKDSCYRAGYAFAGVQEGNQCWCGTHIPGEWASNQADCNIPCSGFGTTFCGGSGLLQIFQALDLNLAPISSTGTGTVDAGSGITSTGIVAGTTSTGGVSETRSSAGAGRNIARWW